MNIWLPKRKFVYLTQTVIVIKLKEIYNRIIEEITPPKYTLYCDMDGVLVDFEKRFEKYSGGLSPNEYRDKYDLNAFWKLVDGEGVGFWVGMPWMPDGEQLYNYIKPNLYSLLSSPSFDNSSRLGKRLWVKKHIPGTKLILAARKNKQDYAEERPFGRSEVPAMKYSDQVLRSRAKWKNSAR